MNPSCLPLRAYLAVSPGATMWLRRFRTALLVTVVAAALTGVKWDTAVDLSARQRAYDQIQHGMTLREVESLMGWPGEMQFIKVSGDPDHHARQWKEHGFPHRYKWEDAYTTVVVDFRAPEPNPPVVAWVWRETKRKPELGGVWRWRAVLCALWLLAFYLLVLGLLTPNSPNVSNLPSAPGASSSDGPLP